MALSNLPPGVTEIMLPGNSPMDEWADTIWDNMDPKIIEAMHMSEFFKRKVMLFLEDYGLEDDPIYMAEKINDLFYDEAIETLEE